MIQAFPYVSKSRMVCALRIRQRGYGGYEFYYFSDFDGKKLVFQPQIWSRNEFRIWWVKPHHIGLQGAPYFEKFSIWFFSSKSPGEASGWVWFCYYFGDSKVLNFRHLMVALLELWIFFGWSALVLQKLSARWADFSKINLKSWRPYCLRKFFFNFTMSSIGSEIFVEKLRGGWRFSNRAP